jgi:hypothetical protein
MRSTMNLRFAPLAALTLLAAPADAVGKVFVVAPSGPYTNIQAAINAAGDGDVVLVEGGTYAGFQIPNKGVSVIANAGATVTVTSAISVVDLAATRDVVLQSLQVALPNSTLANALDIGSSVGSIRVDGCTLPGANYFMSSSAPSYGTFAARIAQSTDITFSRCDLHGGFSPINGGTGLHLTNSKAAMYDSMTVGATGGSMSPDGACSANNGGSGAFLLPGSYLFSSGGAFVGGDGGNATSASFGFCAGCADGGYGNSGLHVSPGADARLIDNRFRGGLAGKGWPGCGSDGGAGGGLTGVGAAVVPIPSRHAQLLAPLHEGATVSVTVRGVPGDAVWLMRADGTSFRVRVSGVQLVDQLGPATFLGTVGADGKLTTTLAAGNLAVGEEGRIEFLQAFHVSGTAQVFGPPMNLVTLDAAF